MKRDCCESVAIHLFPTNTVLNLFLIRHQRGLKIVQQKCRKLNKEAIKQPWESFLEENSLRLILSSCNSLPAMHKILYAEYRILKKTYHTFPYLLQHQPRVIQPQDRWGTNQWVLIGRRENNISNTMLASHKGELHCATSWHVHQEKQKKYSADE